MFVFVFGFVDDDDVDFVVDVLTLSVSVWFDEPGIRTRIFGLDLRLEFELELKLIGCDFGFVVVVGIFRIVYLLDWIGLIVNRQTDRQTGLCRIWI